MAETQSPVSAFDAVIKIRYLDDTNATFTEQDGFLSLKTTLPNDEGTVEELVFPFTETQAFTVLGKNKLNIYHGKQVYQLKGSKRFNALKYVQFFHRYQNIKAGKNDEFLGL